MSQKSLQRKRRRDQNHRYTNRSRSPYKNATGIEYLDRLIGEEGVNTNVKVDVPPTVFIYAGIALFVGIVGSIVVAKAITRKK